MDGSVRRVGGRYILRFERELPHAIDEVWGALTEPKRLADWLADSGEIELRVGGRVHLPDPGIESTVTELDPPKLLAYGWKTPDWDGGLVRFELEPTTTGTKLIFTHDMPKLSEAEERRFRKTLDLPDDWEQLSGTLAGWHTILGQLTKALEGDPEPFSPEVWNELNEHYKRTTVR